MHISEHSTVTALEELLDLLRARAPDTRQVLEQVTSILEQEPCAKELQAAADAAVEIIEQLIVPVLSQDKLRLDQASALQACWRDESFTGAWQTPSRRARQEEILKEMSGWVIDCSESEPGSVASSAALSVRGVATRSATSTATAAESEVVALPRTLFARLTAVLRLMCESEEALVAQVEGWQGQAEVPWAEVSRVLQEVQTAGHRAAVLPWTRQRRAFYNALLQVADACEKGVGREDGDAPQLLEQMRQPGGRVEAHRTHGLLYARVTKLHHEARSLKMKQDDSRERALQLKDRLDQLEKDLTRARRDQFLDPATGIPDRFSFSAHLQRYLERATHLGEVFSLVLFHFYNLQPLLDSLDGATGVTQGSASERLVTALVDDMRSHIPEGSFLARLSAERFVILLPKHSGPEGEAVGLAIANVLGNTCFSLDGQEVTVEALFGCAAYQSGMDAAQMLEVTNRLAASAHAQTEGAREGARQVRTC